MAETKSVALGVAIGCLAVVLGLVGMAGACGYWVYRQQQQMEAEMTDPDARRERVLEVLGAQDLPEGYYPMVGFSVPFVLHAAILTDHPTEPGEKPERIGQRGFIYVETLGLGQNEAQLRDYFTGKTDDPSVLNENGFHLDVDEVIGRGTLPLTGDDMIMFMSQRADLSMRGYSGRGLSSLILVDCAADERRRMGFWFVPDPDPDAPVEELDLTGTPADEGALAAFLAHFRFCGE